MPDDMDLAELAEPSATGTETGGARSARDLEAV